MVRQVKAARLLSEARQALEGEDDRALRGVRAGMGRKARTISLGLLKMAPLDSQSSYNSQHPVDVAAALTSYDPVSMTGVLCFSTPTNLAIDKLVLCVAGPFFIFNYFLMLRARGRNFLMAVHFVFFCKV